MLIDPPVPADEPVAPPLLVRALRTRYSWIKKNGRRIRRAARHEVHAHYRRQPVRPDTVFYESFAGNGMLCNPEAIFRGLLDDPQFRGFTHIWALRDKHENRSILAEFARHPRVRFVRMGSIDYFAALATSGYLVNNATFPTEFSKRVGQTYLNTWHGTPLKRMGYDIGDPASRVANVIRNFLQADYLLAANPFMIDQMYEKAHLLSNIYRGRFIDEGYPRIDQQFMAAGDRQRMRRRLEEATGAVLGDRKVVLYAPTWKGTNFNRPEDDIRELVDRVSELRRGLDPSRFVVLLKTHQVVHRYASTLPGLDGVLVPNEIPTNSVLGATDILVTDYSSIFFDFLATGRPIAFLTPDIDDYTGYRGLYFEPSEWPGSVVKSVPQLVEVLRAIDSFGVGEGIRTRYESMRTRFANREDGGATARIIDIVFRGVTEGYRISEATRDDRTTLLINGGGMRPNGITSSLINLLEEIDYTRFDVSVVFPNYRRRAIVEKQRELNPQVRQFARVGGMNGSKLAHLKRRLSWRKGDLRGHRTDPAQRKLWDDEWARCFGDSSFDEVIDFSGYGPLYSTLLLHAPDARRSIWQHNDMAADAHRVTRGRRRFLRDLTGVFSLYREYDHLVSVSPALRDINRDKLSSFAEASKFVTARNLTNGQRILENAAVDLIEALADPYTEEVPEWASHLGADAGRTTFVTVGRLSPEKNQQRLLDAFSVVHRSHPQSQLILVGSGPLRGALEARAAELEITDSVIFAGQQSNPHAIMAASDCFVLSSDYEGQPMVLLEAMTIGLPVVTVAFGSVADALPDGTGLIVEQNVEGLVDGMNAFLNGEVPNAPFDPAAYNRGALAEFYRAIGVDTAGSVAVHAS